MTVNQQVFFRRNQSTQLEGPTNQPDIVEQSGASSNRKRYFRRFYDPETIAGLLTTDNLGKLLTTHLVFIQNTQQSAERLVRNFARVSTEPYEFIIFQTHIISLETISQKLRDPNEFSTKPQVWIIETTDISDHLDPFCKELALLNSLPIGIWIRGYVRDLNPKTLSFFSALFIFDMSSDEYEILRSVISISNDSIEDMRNSSGELGDTDKVLFFLNYSNIPDAPLLKRNPTILSPTPLSSIQRLRTPSFSIYNNKGEINMGDKLSFGNITNMGGIQNLGKFTSQVISQLVPTEQGELGSALKTLAEAIGASSNLTDDKKQEHLQMISQIGEEVSKSKPNKSLIKALGEGLLSALKAVPDVAKAVLAIEPFLRII